MALALSYTHDFSNYTYHSRQVSGKDNQAWYRAFSLVIDLCARFRVCKSVSQLYVIWYFCYDTKHQVEPPRVFDFFTDKNSPYWLVVSDATLKNKGARSSIINVSEPKLYGTSSVSMAGACISDFKGMIEEKLADDQEAAWACSTNPDLFEPQRFRSKN